MDGCKHAFVYTAGLGAVEGGRRNGPSSRRLLPCVCVEGPGALAPACSCPRRLPVENRHLVSACDCVHVSLQLCVCQVSRRLSVGNRPCVDVYMCLLKHVCSMSEMILVARDVTPSPPSLPLSCAHTNNQP